MFSGLLGSLQIRLRSPRECLVMTRTKTAQSARVRRTETRRETLLTDFAIVALPPEDRRRAALAVCARSGTADEARELLAALGLLEDTALRGAA